MKTEFDCIIVGQGLAGSALALELLQRGKRILVFDDPSTTRASRVAAGIFNPITGRAMSLTYLAEKLFPYLHQFYTAAEDRLNGKFFFPMPVYRPFGSLEEGKQWKGSMPRQFVTEASELPWEAGLLQNPFGGLLIEGSGYLAVEEWTSSVRRMLITHNAYRGEYFQDDKVEAAEKISYRDITASKIIFANGMAARISKWFQWLPLQPLKGETLTIRIDKSIDRIISRGVYLVPGRKEKTYLVGSTYQHPPFKEGVSGTAEQQISQKLKDLILTPFDVVHQDWGIRPTVPDRRPLLGCHPEYGNVIIFNGMGTKGVSLAPYFARCLADWMDGRGTLPGEVNIYRFKSLYSG